MMRGRILNIAFHVRFAFGSLSRFTDPEHGKGGRYHIGPLNKIHTTLDYLYLPWPKLDLSPSSFDFQLVEPSERCVNVP